MDTPYGELPAGGSGTPSLHDPQVPMSTAFDITRGLSNGIQALKRNVWVFWVGGLLKACTEGGSGGSGNNSLSEEDVRTLERLFDGGGGGGGGGQGAQNGLAPSLPTPWSADGLPDFDPELLVGLGMGFLVALGVAVLVLVVLLLLFQAWFLPGWIRVQAAVARTGTGTFSDLFSGGDVFWTSLGWILVSGFMGLVVAVVGIAPLAAIFAVDGVARLAVGGVAALWLVGVFAALVYLRLCLAFVGHSIALEGLGVMAAIDRSFALSRDGRGTLLVYMAVLSVGTYILGVLGYLLCCVGVLLTVPARLTLRDYGYTEGFLRLTRPPDEVAGYACSGWD